MKHVGATIKKYVEDNGIKKIDLAEKMGMSNNYLSNIFARETMDAAMLERFCIALGISPMSFFETDKELPKVSYSNIKAKAAIGKAEVNINNGEMNQEKLEALLAEKERTIQILLAASGLKLGTDSGHKQD